MNSTIRLGAHEATVLTNNSKFMTIVSDLPCRERYRTNFSSSFSNTTGKYVRGSRPMHKSTFSLEENPMKMDYITSTYKAHSGEHKWEPHVIPNKSQSLHLAHFSIGSSTDLDLKTQTMKSYYRKKLIPASILHEGQRRWNDQVFTGAQMDKSLRYVGNERVDHISTYSEVHDAFGRRRGKGKIAIKRQPQKYNIISGAHIGPVEEKSFRLVSGNKVLQTLRKETQTGILG